MSSWRVLARRIAQTARLMVGVYDYDAYLAHRQAQHPGEPVLDRTAFYRACVDARYHGKHGRINKCPC